MKTKHISENSLNMFIIIPTIKGIFHSVEHVTGTLRPWRWLDRQLWASVCVMCKTTPAANAHTADVRDSTPCLPSWRPCHWSWSRPKLSSHHTKICQVWLPSRGLPVLLAGSETSKPDPCELHGRPLFSATAHGEVRWGKRDLLTDHEFDLSLIVWWVYRAEWCADLRLQWCWTLYHKWTLLWV